MENIKLTATQIVAIAFALTTGSYIIVLNTKPQLTPHEAQTHQVLLDTHQLASRALFFPTLPPTTGKKDKNTKDKNKKRKKQLKPQTDPKQ